MAAQNTVEPLPSINPLSAVSVATSSNDTLLPTPTAQNDHQNMNEQEFEECDGMNDRDIIEMEQIYSEVITKNQTNTSHSASEQSQQQIIVSALNPAETQKKTPTPSIIQVEDEHKQVQKIDYRNAYRSSLKTNEINIHEQIQNKLNIFDEKETRISNSNLQIKRRHRGKNRSSLMGSTSLNITVQFPTSTSSEHKVTKSNQSISMQNISRSRQNSETIQTQPRTREGSRIENFSSSDPVHEIIEILKKDIVDRKKHEVDILVNYFEHFEILSEDVDNFCGQHTFRALIKETKYKYAKYEEYVYEAGDENDFCFYFILQGMIRMIDEEINAVDLTEHHIFGEKEMYNMEQRESNCLCKSMQGIHLAYWDMDAYDLYIRPIKELNNDIKTEHGLLHDKYGKLLTENDLVEKASMFLDDAIHGRSFKMHRNGSWPKKINRFLNKKYVRIVLIMICLLWLGCLLVEPPSSWRDSNPQTSTYDNIMLIIYFEWFVFFIFLTECLLRFYSFGRKWFFGETLHIARCILLCIFFFDLLIATILNGHSFRFSRVCRPFFLMLFIRDLRRQYFILVNCIPSLVEIALLYVTVNGIFSRMGYHLFHHSADYYQKYDFLNGTGLYEKELRGSKVPDTFLYDSVWDSFDTFFLSSNTLFVLLTTENYPEVLWPAWSANKYFPVYFMIYLCICTFFLMNLFAANVYTAYENVIGTLDIFDEKREATALRLAWSCLDYQDNGYIDKHIYSKLMMRLKPKYKQFEINVLFKLMDPNENGRIEVEEFSMMMINCLYLSISKRSKHREDLEKLYLQKLGKILGKKYGYDILSFFTSTKYEYFIIAVTALDFFALSTYHFIPSFNNYADFICILILILDVPISIVIQYQSNIKEYFDNTKNSIFFLITIIQFIGSLLGIQNDKNWLSGIRFIGISRVLLLASFVRDKFSILKSSITNTLSQTIIYMIPIFVRICFYLVIGLMYIFAVIGMEMFSGKDAESWGILRCDGAKRLEADPYALFCDAKGTFITLFQIIVTNNWHIIMYQAVETMDSYFVAIYFVLFFILGPILTVNFLLAVFFDMFNSIAVQDQDNDVLLNKVDDMDENNNEQQQQMNALREHQRMSTLHEQRATTMSNMGQDGKMNIAKIIFDEIEKKDFVDANGNSYTNMFTGKDAVECILSLKYAMDEEEAIDYLSLLMDETKTFCRIDVNAENQFENGQSSHYQWISDFFQTQADNQEDDVEEEEEEEETLKVEEFDLKVRHSYGGFQRLQKHNIRSKRVINNDEAGNEHGHRHTQKQSTILNESNSPIAGFTSTKSNPFSTRNVLAMHTSSNEFGSPKSDSSNDMIIDHGLVILIGQNLQKYSALFEELYNFAVIKADNLSSLVVSKFFNVHKYDGVILVINQIKFTKKEIFDLFTKQLDLSENIGKMAKLIISIKNEFEYNDEGGNEDENEEEVSDGTINLLDDADDLYELFGIIETQDINFSKHFIDELTQNYNDQTHKSLVTLTSNIQQRLANKLCLNQFDPNLLLFKLKPTIL